MRGNLLGTARIQPQSATSWLSDEAFSVQWGEAREENIAEERERKVTGMPDLHSKGEEAKSVR
jgi:hypothetical protein